MLLALSGLPFLLGIDGCGGGGLVSVDQSTEIRIGQQAAADIERQYGVVNDPVPLNRINTIGRRIAAVSQRPGLPWTFRILNQNSINAISLPGGYIYVTRGLLGAGVSDAELAGVIGHEVAHVNERHSVRAIERGMTYSLLSELVLGRSSQALQTAANVAIQYAIELPHSRQDEYESDDVGMRLAYNAGYPAGGLLAFLQRLQSAAGPSRTPEWMSTHPLTPDRIARAQQQLAQVQTQPRPVPIVYVNEKDAPADEGLKELPNQ